MGFPVWVDVYLGVGGCYCEVGWVLVVFGGVYLVVEFVGVVDSGCGLDVVLVEVVLDGLGEWCYFVEPGCGEWVGCHGFSLAWFWYCWMVVVSCCREFGLSRWRVVLGCAQVGWIVIVFPLVVMFILSQLWCGWGILGVWRALWWGWVLIPFCFRWCWMSCRVVIFGGVCGGC